jgi:hypothetical protein
LRETFEQFWKVYPKKKSKGDAEKAWKVIAPDEALLQRMGDGLSKAVCSIDWCKEGGKYIPYPATWLRDKGWEDDYTIPAAATKFDEKTMRNIAVLKRWLEKESVGAEQK